MTQRPTPALRVACSNFKSADADALARLLGLVQPYLRQTWGIGDPADAHVVLVNLDEPQAKPAATRGRVVGCATKPRLHPAGTIHRPVRVPELLALLTEAGARQESALPARGNVETVDWSYALNAWPIDFEHWPRNWWPIFAYLSHGHRPRSEIIERLGVSAQELDACIERLARRGLVDRHADPRRHPPRSAVGQGWRNLAARVGQFLGFAA